MDVEIILPPNLAVDVDVSSFMGNVEERHRTPPEPDPARPMLRIVGAVRLGNLEIMTRLPGETRRQAAKRISGSVATIGTALAALAAALIEAYSRSNISNAALNGVVVISLGVIFYTLRDRLKDAQVLLTSTQPTKAALACRGSIAGGVMVGSAGTAFAKAPQDAVESKATASFRGIVKNIRNQNGENAQKCKHGGSRRVK